MIVKSTKQACTVAVVVLVHHACHDGWLQVHTKNESLAPKGTQYHTRRVRSKTLSRDACRSWELYEQKAYCVGVFHPRSMLPVHMCISSGGFQSGVCGRIKAAICFPCMLSKHVSFLGERQWADELRYPWQTRENRSTTLWRGALYFAIARFLT